MGPRTLLRYWEKYRVALIRIQSTIPLSSDVYPGHLTGIPLTQERQKNRYMDKLLQEFCGRNNLNVMQGNVTYLTVSRRSD
jgi:hypothetical protein